jgi:hypothetical protein
MLSLGSLHYLNMDLARPALHTSMSDARLISDRRGTFLGCSQEAYHLLISEFRRAVSELQIRLGTLV